MWTITVSDEKEQQCRGWQEEHLKTCAVRPDFTGSIFSLVIVPGGLGNSITVRCPCGAEKYLDAGDEWL